MSSSVAPAKVSTTQEGISKLNVAKPTPYAGSNISANSKYPEYTPSKNANTTKQPALVEIPYDDRALYADPALPNLLPTLKLASKEVGLEELSPKFGSVVKGVQLASLVDNPKAKDELALLLAQRGVLVFHNQEDFFKLGPGGVTEFASYFGVLHEHQISNTVEGHPKLLGLTGKGVSHTTVFRNSTSSTGFHSDVTYELQPPSYTFLSLLEAPSSGGDTVFIDAREAYDRLSPGFRERLAGLTATHSGVEQHVGSAKAGMVPKRDAIISSHPVVRQNPVTKRKSLFVNKEFTRAIEGYKKEESEALLGFLYQHLGNAVDFQIRASLRQYSIVFWDNRSTLHTATVDYDSNATPREGFRLTVTGETPVENI